MSHALAEYASTGSKFVMVSCLLATPYAISEAAGTITATTREDRATEQKPLYIPKARQLELARRFTPPAEWYGQAEEDLF